MWNAADSDVRAARPYLLAGIIASESGRSQILSTANILPGQPIPEFAQFEATSWIAVVAPIEYPLFMDAAASLTKMLDASASMVMVLIAHKDPPLKDNRRDGAVRSFLCSTEVFRRLLEHYPASSPERLSFLLLSSILDGVIPVDRVVVTQLPIQRQEATAAPIEPARVIMAHRGMARHLSSALRSIGFARDPKPAVSVGLDGGTLSKYEALRLRHPDAEFLYFSPAPVGPYVIRQDLIQRSSEPVLIFQDSDDFSTWDRFVRLQQELHTGACDLVGSHELRINQMQETVHPIRFPIDVNAALETAPVHALLHGTSAIARFDFFKAGGLSTDQIFSGDTQFLWRAHFALRIRNVDAFLYLRRVHKVALTIHPLTSVLTPARESLRLQRCADFRAIQQGQMLLEESSLRPMHRTTPYQVRPL